MTRLHRFPVLAAGALLLGSAAYAQSVVSAKAGLIHYTEGDVYLQDKLVEPTGARFPEMKNGDILRTADGRAEMLLTPGSMLWMKENSSIKMVSNRLAHTAIEVLSGSVVVECAEVNTSSDMVFTIGDTKVDFGKKGLVRIDAEPRAVKVYSGEAIVNRGSDTLTLKEGRQTLLTGVLQPEKFDNKIGDSFYRWASRRDAAFAAANIAAARNLSRADGSMRSSRWSWNPWLGMFTYVPYSGRYFSPFGYAFYSPGSVYGVYEAYYYNPRPWGSMGGYNAASSFGGATYNSDLGYSVAGRGSQGYSNPGVSAPMTSAPAAATSVSAGRGAAAGGGTGAGRGDAGGGGRGGR